MNRIGFYGKKFISILLVMSMLASLLSGCKEEQSNGSNSGSTSSSVADSSSYAQPDKEQTVESTEEDIVGSIDEDGANDNKLSTDWEDYYGDVETFVYGLMINELQYKYDVFQAYVELSDGMQVYGIAYTDYSECYVNTDETEYCFEAGFIPFVGELDVPEDDFNSGLTIYNLEYVDKEASFIWAYGSNAFQEHCVVYGQYVKYGVDETGKIFYESNDFVQSECDESLGSLYSYDEGRYLYDEDVGTYINVTGTSLYSLIDYDDLQSEINEILETQDENFVSVDVKSCAFVAQEAVTNYLLSLQEESFLGYDVNELIEAARNLDPLECYRLTQDGLIAITQDYDGGASALTKWLVGTGCIIVISASMVTTAVSLEVPAVAALSNAIGGIAIETFMEVVVSGETLDNIDWESVAITAVVSGISGLLGPYIDATCSGVTYFLAASALDGFIGGIEQAASAWMEDETSMETITSFGYGFALGFVISAGLKAVGEVADKIASKVGPSINKLVEKYIPNLTAKISELSASAGNIIYTMKAAEDATKLHSEYISKKTANKQLRRLIKNGSNELVENAFDHLSGSDIVDADSNPLTKKVVENIFDNVEDGGTLAYYKKGGELIEIVKENGMVGIVFDSAKYQTVTLPSGLINDRNANFTAAAKELKKQWLNDPSAIPESIAYEIKKSGVELADMSDEVLVTKIRSSDWVLHENIDMKTITLVPRSLHDVNQGGISHMGGYALAKYIKSHMGREFFESFISTAATGAVQAVN